MPARSSQAALRTAIFAVLDPVRGIREKIGTALQISRRNEELLSVQALPLPRGNDETSAMIINQRIAACALVIHGPGSESAMLRPGTTDSRAQS